MTKLNQVIAIEKGIKTRVHSEVSNLYKLTQKADLFNGFAKQYQPIDDTGEQLPPENRKVQLTAGDIIRQTAELLSDLFDVTAAKDWSNCNAKADIVVGGQMLVPQVPVSYLLFLEKNLTDVRTFVNSIPVLDDSENWALDTNSNLFKTAEIRTHRQKKVQKPLVLFPATDKHPAQTQLITEDVLAGYWVAVKQSGSLTKPAKEALAKKVETLLRAVKEAREAANGVDVTETPNVSIAIFGYLFGGTQ